LKTHLGVSRFESGGHFIKKKRISRRGEPPLPNGKNLGRRGEKKGVENVNKGVAGAPC